jgi:mannitol operon repressor
MRDDDLKHFSAFLKEFQAETDRGAALVAGAVIDQQLGDILRSFFVSGKNAEDLLEGGTAPLGTFSARIKAAYALGLIDGFELKECDLIRKIRNEFAHGIHGTRFTDSKIAALCGRLQTNMPPGVVDPRSKFIVAVVLTTMRLTYRAERVAKEKRVTRDWPLHDIEQLHDVPTFAELPDQAELRREMMNSACDAVEQYMANKGVSLDDLNQHVLHERAPARR